VFKERINFKCLKTENVSKFSEQRGMGEREWGREKERVKYEL